MLIKITTVALVLTVCNGMPALHPKMEQPHSKQAISSQSFTREDVPLSYEFSAVHTYTTDKTVHEEPHKNVYSHQRGTYTHNPAHQTRQQKLLSAQHIQPVHQSSHNSKKVHLKSFQYAPVIHSGHKEGAQENLYFNPTTNHQEVLVPYRIIYVKPTGHSDLGNMPLPDSTLNRLPGAHLLHLNTYQKNPLHLENTNKMGMQKIVYPQLLQMFLEHQTSANLNQHTSQPFAPIQPASNIEAAVSAQNVRQYRIQSQSPVPYSTPQKPHFQTDVPKSYQFVPVKTGNHQHHPGRLTDNAVQHPTHTQAIFRTNNDLQETQASDNIKITYLYPVTAPRTPVNYR